ncbi:MAG: hypothetical protein HOQ05_12845 [Corynebacteriales bacterium]|nr:hypothetical protein [Mycobacteriales bacterium]
MTLGADRATRVDLDLVCGPDGPLPDSSARYRLLEHLGAGGQAQVYRAVRISGGLRSSPVTIKAFKADERLPIDEQLRFWDKGDAVLMDLNSRGVPNICLRVDGFYGASPRPAAEPAEGDRVPFQVLDYLPGMSLTERLRDDQQRGNGPQLDGGQVLRTLAEILRQLHAPEDAELPVLHMDLKPANVMILPTGQAKLIDFTASRYYNAAHLTSVAYSLESGGPEAHDVNRDVTPAYDIHGFGAIAYYLVTGWHPREQRHTPALPGSGITSTAIRRHPMLESHPTLEKHLVAPLADRPGDRPATRELEGWIARLTELAATLPTEHHFARWNPAHNGFSVPNFSVPAAFAEVKVPEPVANDRTHLFDVPIEPTPAETSPPVAPPTQQFQPNPPNPTAVFPAIKEPSAPRSMKGSARVPDYHEDYHDPEPQQAPPPYAPPPYQQQQPGPGWPPPPPPRHDPRMHPPTEPPAPPVRSRGRGLVSFAAVIFVLGWLVWFGSEIWRTQSLAAAANSALMGLGITVAAVVGVYWLTRLACYLVRSSMEMGPRRSTLIPNLTTSFFLAACGIAFLSFTPLDPMGIIHWIQENAK